MKKRLLLIISALLVLTLAISLTACGGDDNNNNNEPAEAANYTIEYNLDGGVNDVSNPSSYTKNDTFTLNAPTKDGYEFDGWSGTGISGKSKDVTVKKGSTGDRSYKANWSIPTYKITYILVNGKVNGTNPTSYTAQTDTFTLINPTKDGYEFDGWSEKGVQGKKMEVTIEKGSKGDRTFTATWKSESFTISYDLSGGTVNGTNPVSYNVDTPTFTLINPTKDGYDFEGWSGTGISGKNKNLTISKGNSGSREYTANWKATQYVIRYNLNEGTVTNPVFYDIETDSFTLINPTRAGYVFEGWSGTGIDGMSKSVTIEKGSTGERTYTANWSEP